MASVFSKKDFTSTKWFTVEKIIQLIVGVFIVPKIFNTLGTVDIGKLKFVESIVGMLTPLFFLGLSAICIREIVFNPKRSNQILATAFYLRLISWGFIFTGIIIYLTLADTNELIWLYIIIATSYLFRLTDVFEYYLIAQKWSKFIFISKIISLLIIVSLQYYGVKQEFDVFYFAQLIALDFLIQGSIYFIILHYKKELQFKQWTFSFTLSKQLLKMSTPLLLSNAVVMFYITIDEMFLKYFHDDHAIGVFGSVQFLVITLSWAIGFSIVNALFPSLAESYKTNTEEYYKKIKQLIKALGLLGLFIGVFYSIFGNYILDVYFSSSYTEAKIPLLIFCWAPLFIFMGMIYEKHLINSNDIKKNVYRFLIGCIVNMVLCYLLIPDWNVIGVSIAVLASHFITNVGYIFMDSKSRTQVLYYFK